MIARVTRGAHKRIPQALLLVLPWVAACGDDAGDTRSERVAQTAGAMVNGTPVSAADQRKLGLVRVSGAGFFCSGTLVTPDWALTAGHCLLAPANAITVSIVTADGAGTLSRTADRAVEDQDSDGLTELADMALLHMSETAPAGWPNTTTFTADTRPPTTLTTPPSDPTVACYGVGANTLSGSPPQYGYDRTWGSGIFTIDSRFFSPNVNGDVFGYWRNARYADGGAIPSGPDGGPIAVGQIVGPGDSGGPCFYVDPSGVFHHAGVLHGLSTSVDSQGNVINDQNMAATYTSTFMHRSWIAATTSSQVQRTIVFVYGPTQVGQDMFLRGGIDETVSLDVLGLNCRYPDGSPNYKCALPLFVANDEYNATTTPWIPGDHYLDWYGAETSTPLMLPVNPSAPNRMFWAPVGAAAQSAAAQGTPANWTTSNPSNAHSVGADGYGYTPLNHWGDHNWMVDMNVDCAKGVPDSTHPNVYWFEVKSFISNGGGWEGDVNQSAVGGYTPPYRSKNHFALCGMISRFQRGTAAGTEFEPIPAPAPSVELQAPPLY